jgi:hypothetical protein
MVLNNAAAVTGAGNIDQPPSSDEASPLARDLLNSMTTIPVIQDHLVTAKGTVVYMPFVGLL